MGTSVAVKSGILQDYAHVILEELFTRAVVKTLPI